MIGGEGEGVQPHRAGALLDGSRQHASRTIRFLYAYTQGIHGRAEAVRAEEEQRGAEAPKLGRSLVRAHPLSGLVADELTPGVDATPEVLRSRGREGLTNFFPPAGTCPMGEGGVTEPDGRLRGTDNLYIADASILPEIPPVPTNLTVLAAAEKVAAGMREGTAA